MIKNVLITGGLGLIGSDLAIKLASLGYKVSIIDNCSTGKIKNIPRHVQDKINIYKKNILDEKFLEKIIDKNHYVFHLAASVGVKNILSNKIKSIETNVNGTEKILRLCSKFKKKVLIASTSEVYGKSNNKFLKETDNYIIGNSNIFRWSYSASKIVDEFLSKAYSVERKLKVLVVRFFNVVGPKQSGSYGMVIPRFIQAALKNKRLKVYGSGKQTRTFLHVDDATNALILLMKKNYFNDILNLGGRTNISINDLAKKIIKLSNSKSKIKKISYKFAYSNNKKFASEYEDILNRHPSTKKLNRIINFKIEFTIDEIIKDIIKFKKNEL